MHHSPQEGKMTEPTSTAVAKVEDGGVGSLPAELQQAIALRKMHNIAAAELAKLSWGEKLDLVTRRGISEWARQFGIDPQTEIDLLGGKLYPNAKYYLRRLSEFVAEGVVEYAVADHIGRDSRLEKLAEDGDEWAKGEAARRMRERIRHGVREEAVAACVFRIKLRHVGEEIVGVKQIVTDKNDPVGKGNPMETVETRAARRAMRLIASHVPRFQAEEARLDTAMAVKSQEISAKIATFKAENAQRGITPLALSATSAYGEDDPAATPDADDLALDQQLLDEEAA
jgi:hypothetical protein